MDLSFALPVSGSWATPENVVTIARLADEKGYRGVWTFQRVLFPTTFEIAPVYRSVLDPLATLAFAAAVTTRVRLGVAVVNGPFYAPAVLAKQLTTIDVLSGGRLDAGIGLGWSPDEYAAAGLAMEHRGRRFNEWLDCLNALFTQDPVEFEGEFYSVPRSHVSPRPVQQPRPPLLIGGAAAPALRRAGQRGDGWISSSRAGIEEVRSAVLQVRAAAEEAGKARTDVRCVVRGVTVLTTGRGETGGAGADRALLTGSVDQIHEDLALYENAGVDEVFLDLNFDPAVGSPDADPERALDLARTALDAFAPSAG